MTASPCAGMLVAAVQRGCSILARTRSFLSAVSLPAAGRGWRKKASVLDEGRGKGSK